MADEPTEGEELSAAQVAAARQEFLGNPPAILDPNEPAEPAAAVEDDDGEWGDEPTGAGAVPEGTGGEPAVPAPAPAAVPADPFAEFGGAESVRTAWEVQQALRTEQGVRALVANGLQALGYSVDQVREALDASAAGGAPAPTTPVAADPFSGLEDDDVVTVAQTRDLVARAAKEAAEQAIAATQQQLEPVQQTIAAQQQRQAQGYTDAAIMGVLGPVPTDPEELASYTQQVEAIVERGSRYYDPQQWADPNHIQAAVTRANAELESEAKARYDAYKARKKAARDSQPVNTGGGAGGEGPLPEPKNLAEARAQAEKVGFFK